MGIGRGTMHGYCAHVAATTQYARTELLTQGYKVMGAFFVATGHIASHSSQEEGRIVFLTDPKGTAGTQV